MHLMREESEALKISRELTFPLSRVTWYEKPSCEGVLGKSATPGRGLEPVMARK